MESKTKNRNKMMKGGIPMLKTNVSSGRFPVRKSKSKSLNKPKCKSSSSDSAYSSVTEDENHRIVYRKPPQGTSKLVSGCHAPTQSITNGDKTDNSDESGSIRGGYSSGQERSRSRDGSRDRERRSREGSMDRERERERRHEHSDRGSAPPPEHEYGVVQTQPRSSRGKRPVPRRHTVGGSTLNGRSQEEKETERSKDAFMDMLATRYPQYAEKISSTASEDGFPVRGRSRDPRRRATITYNPQHDRSLEYEGTMSEVDGPTFHRGGFVRSSLPATRTPTTPLDKPPGLVFLIFGDETKKALLPNEITHLDTVRALFVRSFPGKLTMSFLESPKRKIYILDPRTNIYYQIEDLRDIKDRTVLRVHECDSHEPQRVVDKPEVRGRTIHIPPGSQGYYGGTPSSAITSQVQKAHTLPAHMEQPIYMSHDDVTQSPVRTSYERSRSLTPDPSRSAGYAQNPIYGRMGISPERPPPPQDRAGPPDRPPTLRTIPENHQMLNGNRNRNGYIEFVGGMQYHQAPGAPSPSPGIGQRVHPIARQAMSPPAMPTGPRMDPGRRAFSPPPNLQNYDYIQVVPGSQAPPGAPPGSSTYMAKGVRASTVVTPQRATGAPHPSPGIVHQTPGLQVQQSPAGQPPSYAQLQQSWRERSPVGRHSLALSTVPYAGSSTAGQQQRSQSYRVPSTSEREPMLMSRPRSVTPSPIEPDKTRDRIDKMEHQLASLAAWVQTAVIQSSGSTGAPSSVKSSSTTSITSDTSPLLDSASSKLDSEHMENMEIKGLTELASDDTATLSQDMKNNILAIKNQADALRSDLRSLRRLQQINKESILETVDDAWKKIREALSSVPGGENLLIRQQRNEIDVMYKIYLEDKANADKELLDLEHAVEELRSDVLSRQCRVQMSDVEGMALVLSHVTKALGDLKVRFPQLQERLKFVMAAEMEVIVKEERFLKEEPERLDNSLKKCKKLTGTLFTLKRLASVQEHRPPQQVNLTAQAKIPTMDDKRAVLQNIQAMIPNHEARIQGIQAAESSRQRKKKIITQQEALRFSKSLEIATKALKSSIQAGANPSSAETGACTTDIPTTSTPKSMASDTSSMISFAMPMSTSTPKSSSQHPTSQPDVSTTSPSISYPVMSLIRAVSPKGHGDEFRVKDLDYGSHAKEKGSDNKAVKSVEFVSEPAVLVVTSSETSGQSRGSGIKADKVIKPATANLSTQKSAARAAFFSSLSSPTTPTTSTSPLTSVSAPSTESPTEGYSKKISPGVHSSPVRGIPSLVRSSAVSTPSTSVSTSASHLQTHSVSKPSSLPVSAPSGSSVVSSQRFSPASPSNGAQQTGSISKPRTTFTAIPKPYSPTKSTPSPLTPESPKYRIPPSQMSGESGVGKKSGTSIPQSRDPGAKPKKIPPPPPPRKSSRVPGHAVLAVNAATANGQLKHSSATKHSPKSQLAKSVEVHIRGRSDLIEPPKQFANLPLDTKVERKSSIGSLKQFTTPLLESKRDTQMQEKQKSKQSSLASKKISSSNLDSAEKTPKLQKDIDLSHEKQSKLELTSSRKVVDGKVTNISAEKEEYQTRKGSIESTSSSSSLDSQQEVIWVKQKEDLSETNSSVTKISDSSTDQSTISISSSQSTEVETIKPVNGNISGKKPKPPPPERRSSLSSKSQTDTVESKPQKEGKKESKSSVDRLV